jgi:hypothetical protein
MTEMTLKELAYWSAWIDRHYPSNGGAHGF